MWFRAFSIFRFTQSPAPLLVNLADQLEKSPLIPCSSQAFEAFGFVPPLGKHSEDTVINSGSFYWFRMAKNERILPASVIREEQEARIADIELAEGRFVSNKQKKQIKEDVIQELLPKSFTRTLYTDMIIDADEGLLWVNASTDKASDVALSILREAVGSLPVKPVITKTPPSDIMANWMRTPSELAKGWRLSDHIELNHQDGSGATVGIRKLSLDDDDIRLWLEQGFKPKKLRLNWSDQAEVTLDHNLRLTGMKLLDAFFEELERDAQDDPLLEAKTSLLIAGSTYRSLVTSLLSCLGETPDTKKEAESTPSPETQEALAI